MAEGEPLNDGLPVFAALLAAMEAGVPVPVPSDVLRATGLVDRRGPAALVVGRATPGLRTVTVVAAGSSNLAPARALPPLVLGSSLFIQLHVVLGYLLGPAAREALDEARGPAIAVLAVLVVGGVAFWLWRRGARRGLQSAGEACCPACLALGAFAPRAFAVDDLA